MDRHGSNPEKFLGGLGTGNIPHMEDLNKTNR